MVALDHVCDQARRSSHGRPGGAISHFVRCGQAAVSGPSGKRQLNCKFRRESNVGGELSLLRPREGAGDEGLSCEKREAKPKGRGQGRQSQSQKIQRKRATTGLHVPGCASVVTLRLAGQVVRGANLQTYARLRLGNP